MKLSNETLSVLKNYASINSNLTVDSGNFLRTMSPSKAIYSETYISESFPCSFGIYDLNRFLSVLSLFKSPDLTFTDDYVSIVNDSGAEVKFHFSDRSVLFKMPKNFKEPEFSFSFDIDEKQLSELIRASSVLQISDFNVKTESDGVYIKAVDSKIKNSNEYSIKVSENTEHDFSIYLKIESLKLLQDSYTVSINKDMWTKFSSKSRRLNYWVSPETNGYFNK